MTKQQAAADFIPAGDRDQLATRAELLEMSTLAYVGEVADRTQNMCRTKCPNINGRLNEQVMALDKKWMGELDI